MVLSQVGYKSIHVGKNGLFTPVLKNEKEMLELAPEW